MQSSQSQTVEEMTQRAVSAGYRRSLCREGVFSVLLLAPDPLSVGEILILLGKQGKTYNKTSVYREIETLKRLECIKEVVVRSDESLYETSKDHHHHIVCLECGTVKDVHIQENMEHEERRVAREKDFRVLEHAIEFYGVCGRCERSS